MSVVGVCMSIISPFDSIVSNTGSRLAQTGLVSSMRNLAGARVRGARRKSRRVKSGQELGREGLKVIRSIVAMDGCILSALA